MQVLQQTVLSKDKFKISHTQQAQGTFEDWIINFLKYDLNNVFKLYMFQLLVSDSLIFIFTLKIFLLRFKTVTVFSFYFFKCTNYVYLSYF